MKAAGEQATVKRERRVAKPAPKAEAPASKARKPKAKDVTTSEPAMPSLEERQRARALAQWGPNGSLRKWADKVAAARVKAAKAR